MHRSGFLTPLVLALTLGACSNSSDDAAPRRETPATTTSTSSVPSGQTASDCPNRPKGSSRADFDPRSGTYAARTVTLAARHRLRFDVVQWLSGEDANEAYRRANPEDAEGSAPNDYAIVNENPAIYEASLTLDAEVAVLNDPKSAVVLHEIPVSSLAAHLAAYSERVYWLTIENQQITAVCQQYQP